MGEALRTLDTVDVDALQAELERRQAAEAREALIELALRPEGFDGFTQLFWPIAQPGRPLIWGDYLDVTCAWMVDFYAGGDLEGVVNEPPRTGKSTICDVLWPSFGWLHDPTLQFLFITKSDKNAQRDAEAMRRVIRSPEYQALFAQLHGKPLLLDPKQNQIRNFRNLFGGHRVSGTTTTDFIGVGADWLGINDPHDPEDVLGSPEQVARELDQVADRFTDKWTQRLNPGGGSKTIVVAQRLHDADLAGRRLKEGARPLVLPMRAEETPRCPEDTRRAGELLVPLERFTAEDEAEKRRNPRVWATQFQQRPTPREGGLFKEAWFTQTVPPAPGAPAQIIVSIDASFKGGDKNDPCGIGTLARYRNAAWMDVLDIINERMDYPTLRTRVRGVVLDLKKAYPGVPLVVLVEDKANGSALVDDLKKEIPAILPFNPGSKSKYERAQVGSVPILEAGQVRLPIRASWKPLFIHQHTSFPFARHDECVDLLSQALIYMAQHPLSLTGMRTGGRRRDLSEGDADREDRRGRRRSGRRGGW